MLRRLAIGLAATLLVAISSSLPSAASWEVNGLLRAMEMKVEQATAQLGLTPEAEHKEALISLGMHAFFALEECGLTMQDITINIEINDRDGDESTRMLFGFSETGQPTGQVTLGYGLRFMKVIGAQEILNLQREEALMDVLRILLSDMPSISGIGFIKDITTGTPWKAGNYFVICAGILKDDHGLPYGQLVFEIEGPQPDALQPSDIENIADRFRLAMEEINSDPTRLADQVELYQRYIAGEPLSLTGTLFEIAPQLRRMLKWAGVDQGGRIIVRGLNKLHVQLLVDLMFPDLDIIVIVDQFELKRVIESLKNPVTPSRQKSILFITLPMTEERFRREAGGRGGRTFIKTLVEMGYTWETYYDRFVRIMSGLIDAVRAMGITVRVDATSADVKATLRGTQFNYITIVTNNVGDALEITDGLWDFEDIIREVLSLPEERGKGIVINIIAYDGFELAQELVGKGVNQVVFDICQTAEGDSIQSCIITGPGRIPRSLYIYSKTPPGLDGSNPLDVVYNRAIKEFIEEILDEVLPFDIPLDLRAIPVFKCERDIKEYGFG